MSLAASLASSLLRQSGAAGPLRYGSQLLFRRAYAVDSDTHDDFKPKYKTEPAGDVNELFKNDVKSHSVFLYMKGVPDAPNCGFSDLACKILRAYEVQFGSRNVLADPAVREGIKKFSNWPTIPQVYINGEFVGGADILMSMHESGELLKVLTPIRAEQQASKK